MNPAEHGPAAPSPAHDPESGAVHDAVVVGAGFGGTGAAIALRRLGHDDLVILEREDDLGGTWHVDHYPACGRHRLGDLRTSRP